MAEMKRMDVEEEVLLSGEHAEKEVLLSGEHAEEELLLSGEHAEEEVLLSGEHEEEEVLLSGEHAEEEVLLSGEHAEEEVLLSGEHPNENPASSKSLFWKILTAPLAFRRARIITVEPTVFLFGLAMYLTLPITQQFYYQYYAVYYLRQLNHSNLTASGMCIDPSLLRVPLHPDQKNSPSVEHYVKSDSSHFILYSTVLNTVLQAISVLVIGPLTDAFGRKMGLIIASFGAGVSYGILLIVIYFRLSLYVSLVGAVVSGITGNFGVLLMAAFAYAADISSHKMRTLRIGFATAAFFVSDAISEYAGGIWLDRNHCTFEPIMWCAVAACLAAIVYTIVGFPESRSTKILKNSSPSSTNRCFNCSGTCIFASIKAVVLKFWRGIVIFFRPRLVTVELWLALFTLCLYTLNTVGVQLIGVLFYKGYPLHWDSATIGNLNSLSSALHGVVIFLVFPFVTVVLKLADSLIAFLGVIPPIMMFLLVAYYGERLVTWQMFLCKCQLIGP